MKIPSFTLGRLDDGIAWDAFTGNVTSWLGSGWTGLHRRRRPGETTVGTVRRCRRRGRGRSPRAWSSSRARKSSRRLPPPSTTVDVGQVAGTNAARWAASKAAATASASEWQAPGDEKLS